MDETMSKYMYLFRGADDRMENLSPEEKQAHMQQWGAWMGELRKNGKLVDGLPLGSGGKRVKDSGNIVSDGPYAEGKEVVGGYLIVNAGGLDEAVELSRKCPIFEHDGEIEVREILDMNL